MDEKSVLYEVSAFLNELSRSTIRLDDDWDEAEFQRIKGLVDGLLYPDPEPVSIIVEKP